ncbi:hypothetical protein NIIDMKKI_34330 [Mycobacterium kansasii]|uniref:Uncharacterized protein n=1 Tax=Mycobacterium kansasii TaxID=1768 RepID=A0A7G1IBA0_MYCKA|nr:hypothetical protein NIIDMKKI_34330 [Mycobacterium kansasii]
MGVGTGVRVNPALGWDLQPRGLLDRRQDQRRALVNHVVGVHQLGVGPTDHAVLRAGPANLLGGHRGTDPGIGIGHRDGVEARPQLTDPPPVIRHRLAVGDAQRLLEQRVDVGGPVQLNPELGLTRHHNVVTGNFRQWNGFVLSGPHQPRALGLQPGPGTPGFGAGNQHHPGAPLLDVQACLADQRLRCVAADTAVAGGEAAGAEALAEQLSRVAVVRRQHVHHADRVDGRQQRSIGGLPGRRDHQVNRFD